MSGEFGYVWGNHNGYLWQCIENGSDEYVDAPDEMTRTVGELLKKLNLVVRAIAYWKAGDSSQDCPIRTLIETLPEVKDLIARLEAIQEPYARVAKDAAERAVKELIEKRGEA